MAYGGGAAAAAAAHEAAIAQAIKASGAIVRLEPPDFMSILSRAKDRPLVVVAKAGWRKKHYQYLTAYKGLVFYAKSETQLSLPGGAEVIAARQIWIPG